MLHPKVFVTILVIALSGCAKTIYWVKNGGSQAEFNRTQAACHNQAAFLPRTEASQSSSSYYIDTHISPSGFIHSTSRPYQTPYQSMADAFGTLAANFETIALREQYVQNCLTANGWTQVEKSAVTITVPVYAKVGREERIYKGTATGHPDMTGAIKVISGGGNVCVGNFKYLNTTHGIALLICEDGDSAEIPFTALTNKSGYGSGISASGQPIRFVYGLEGDARDRYIAAE